LGRDGKDSETTKTFRRADDGPSDLTVPTGTRFLPSPKEGVSALFNGLNHRKREDMNTHGMSHHSREHRVDLEEAAPDQERAAPPTREF
jgi:hypothetical protein